MQVGLVGTFDVANYGDLLFPYLAQHELARRVDDLELRLYSYRSMSRGTWPYDVSSLRDLENDLDVLDALVVGGGHLIRFDERIAPGYVPTSSSTPHPIGYSLVPTILAAVRGIPVAWNAVGASSPTPEWARELLSRSMRCANYVSVRDPGSQRELSRVDRGTEVQLVPDTGFGVKDFLDDLGPSKQVEQIIDDLGLDGGYVILQPSTRLRPGIEDIREALTPDLGMPVLELPISPALGDRTGLFDLDRKHVRSLESWPDPPVIAGLIAGAEAAIAHSLHLTITALVRGVPVFRLRPPGGTKYEALARFDGVHVFGEGGSRLGELLDRFAGRRDSGPSVNEQRAQVPGHWDRLVNALREESSARPDIATSEFTALTRQLLNVGRRGEDLERSLNQAQQELVEVGKERDKYEEQLDVRERELRDAKDAAERSRAEIERVASELTDALRTVQELEQQREDLRGRLSQEVQEARNRQDEQLNEFRRRERQLGDRVKQLEARLTHSQRDFERLRGRRSVRLALAIAQLFRPLFRLVRKWRSKDVTRTSARHRRQERPGRKSSQGIPSDSRRSSPVRATEAQQEQLERRIVDSLPSSGPSSGPKVSIVVLNRSGEHHLRRLIPRLQATAYEDFELIVVDNASDDGSLEYLESVDAPFAMAVVANEENRSFSAANNQGADAAEGELLLFLNNDVEPMWPSWLGRMVGTLNSRSADAVGARLVYPARPGLDNAGDAEHPDLTLQHRGIHFTTDRGGVPRPRNLGGGEDPVGPQTRPVREVEALTAACLLVRREAFESVGGFTDGYRYGTEDVDLCLKLRADGRRLVYDGGACLWHHEFGTQNLEGRETKRRNRLHNRELFVDIWGRRLFRQVLASKLENDLRWSEDALHVAITITKDDPSAGYGDWFTAHELGEALQDLGWRVSYVERYDQRWYDLGPDVDALIVLLDAFELPKIRRDVVTIAWVRNWTERWLSRPWFNDYDIILASSRTSMEMIEEESSKKAHVFPLATNAGRFSRPVESDGQRPYDAVFVGSYWEEPRRIADALPELDTDLSVRVFGHGWGKTSALDRFAPEPADYEDLPHVYSSANLVIDDTAHHARPYAAVNARVFDALASGTPVVSDNVPGIADLFDEEFPIWQDADDLDRWIRELRDDPERRDEIVERYRSVVMEEHTYGRRALQLQQILYDWLEASRFGICIGVPEAEQTPRWGDYHFARAIQRQLERSGHPTRIFLLPEWEEEYVAREDVIIHLFGLSEYRTRDGQLNVMWNISHPERVSLEQCEAYDAIFVASDSFAETLQSSVDVPVHGLYQATDPDRFYPDPGGPEHELLFVGNSRRVRRRIIDDLAGTSYDLAIYGADWTRDLVDQRYVRGEHVPNQELRRYYSSAMIVLNDHWDDMREHGFISNRIYDALACGAVVVSDHVEGIDEHLDGSVVTYRTRDELLAHIDRLLEDPEERQRRGRRGREVVLSEHTFAHRVRTMLDVIGPSLGQLPAGIGREAETYDPPSPARSVAS